MSRIAAILERMGYAFIRQRGNHRIYARAQRKVVVAMHSGTLKGAIQMSISNGAALSPKESMHRRKGSSTAPNASPSSPL